MSRERLYEGKAKIVYAGDDADHLILHFKDDTSAFDGQRVEQLAGKGQLNNHFNAFIMQRLQEAGVPTHFEALISDVESRVKRLEMIPVECVVRNRLTGSLAKRLGMAEGAELDPPVFEFFLKNDALHDPMVNESHIRTFGWASEDEIRRMKELALKVNGVLKDLFARASLILADFKLEFGRFHGQLLLGDEFSPDGCRLWDARTLEKMDKDRFRRNLGGVVEAYQEVARRLGVPL